MKSYAINLKNQTDLVIRQSNDRRREIEQFINALNKRVETQQNYAKSLDVIGKSVQKFISQKTISSLSFSAFQLNNFNRALQARAFCKSLKDQVLSVLKDTINTQNNEYKSHEKDIKKLEKELMSKYDQVKKLQQKCIDYQAQSQQQLLEYQIGQSLGSVPKQKKTKLKNKSREIYQDIVVFETNYLKSLNQYNNFKNKYDQELEKHLQIFQSHEIARIQRQLDSIMKILIFETSMIKNFEYDINNISNQMTNKDPKNDIIFFIQRVEQKQNSNKLGLLQNKLKSRSLLKECIYKQCNNKFYEKIEFDRNKNIKKLLDLVCRGTEVKQFVGVEKKMIQEINQSYLFVQSFWEGAVISPDDLDKLSQIIQNQNNRHIIYWCLQQYQLSNNIQITKKQGAQNCALLLQHLLCKCIEKKDLFIARKLINLTFNYFIYCTCHQTIPNLSEKIDHVLTEQICNQKIYLHTYIKNIYGMNFLKDENFWEASIFESVQQQLYLAGRPNLQTQQQILMRQKSVILGQLASFCHNIVMFGMNIKLARKILGRFCRLYSIPEDQNRDLSRSIAIACRKYRQIYPQEQLQLSKSSDN